VPSVSTYARELAEGVAVPGGARGKLRVSGVVIGRGGGLGPLFSPSLRGVSPDRTPIVHARSSPSASRVADNSISRVSARIGVIHMACIPWGPFCPGGTRLRYSSMMGVIREYVLPLPVGALTRPLSPRRNASQA